MSRLAGRAIDAVVRHAPSRLLDVALRGGALCPPALRTPLVARACARAASSSRLDRSTLLRTNFGLDRRLRCDLPLGKPDYVFGRPEFITAERGTLALAVELSRDATDFLDVGAHEGLFTFAVHVRGGRPGPRLHAFEPDEILFNRLTYNLTANDVPAVRNQAAAAERSGDVVFHRNLSDDASGSTSGHFLDRHETTSVTVPAVALADYLVARDITQALVKVDVEGAGAAVWRGLSAASSRVPWLLMEILRSEVEAALPARIIREAGVHAYYIRDFTLVHSPDGSFEYVAPFWNWLFCRHEPPELARRLAGTRLVVAGG